MIRERFLKHYSDKKMIDLIRMGGPFMIPLVIVAVIGILLAAKKSLDLFVRHDSLTRTELRRHLSTLRHLGTFSFFLGILAQAVGLYSALGAIEEAADVSPALLFGGLKVSMIAPIFGLIILVVAWALWFVLNARYTSLNEAGVNAST